MYKNVKTLIAEAEERSVPLHRIIIENEAALTDVSEDEVVARIGRYFDVMHESAVRALGTPQKMNPDYISGQSSRQFEYSKGKTLAGTLMNRIMSMALSCCEVNAGMSRICAAPTAGACGILPAVIIGLGEALGSSREEQINALLTASGFGAIIAKNATISGAEGGCQAECGAAGAMAAAAAVYLAGGTPAMCANALAIALMNCLGLVCDPVAGVVQLPCSFRNASQTANALISADMALAGQSSVIPADEVIDAMMQIGRALPSALKETALGGISATPTAKKLEEQLQSTEFERYK